jgi:hypothetical protein
MDRMELALAERSVGGQVSSSRGRYLRHDDGSAILVVLYDGAYGRTLRIDTQRLEALEEVASIFAGLSDGELSIVHLAGREGFVLGVPLGDVVLETTEDTHTSIRSEDLTPTVVWGQPANEWKRSLGLLQGLTARGRQGGAGHQYLTPEGSATLVELAYAE